MPNEARKDMFYNQLFPTCQFFFSRYGNKLPDIVPLQLVPAPDYKDVPAFRRTCPGICRATGSHDFGNPLLQRRCYNPANARFAAFKTALYGGLPVKHNNDMTAPDYQVKRLKLRRNFGAQLPRNGYSL